MKYLVIICIIAGCANTEAEPVSAPNNPDTDSYTADVLDDIATDTETDIGDSSVPEPDLLCWPCNTDADCNDAQCLSYGNAGSFCGTACSENAPCPPGFGCQGGQCKSLSNECSCTDAMIGRSTSCVVENEYGACTGQRTCETSGLSACSAEIPAEDICDGLDNNCDGTKDTVPCDDQNSCTFDSCAGSDGCAYEPLVGETCIDADPCTIESGSCDTAGVCIAPPIDCDDNDPCTADTCVGEAGCVNVDNEQCTCAVDDDCPPPEDRCLGINRCVITEEKPFFHCALDPTTEVICEPSPEDTFCLASECEPATGLCIDTFQNQGAECANPAPLCFEPSTCKDGVCTEGAKLPCNDSNACTTDTCENASGCVFTTVSDAECDDNNICTVELGCDSNLGCLYDDLSNECDDGVDCTLDSCDPIFGCQHQPQGEDCCEFGISAEGYCHPPLTADAGEDQLIDPNTTIVLAATAEGGDGTYSFTWSNANSDIGMGETIAVTPATSTTYTVTVTDGVGNVATDTVTVQLANTVLSLCDWDVIAFDPEAQTQPLADWTFTPDCDQSTQILNAKPSVLLSPLDFEGGSLTGAFRVDTTADDDLIGFVFGWKNQNDFYLMDWKQGGQTFCTASVFEGVSLKKITASEPPLTCPDFFASQGTTNTSILQLAIPPGWNDFTTYQWTLTLEGTLATVLIETADTIVHTFSVDLPDFDGGRFGFYNNSQDSVVYEYFQFVQPAPESTP